MDPLYREIDTREDEIPWGFTHQDRQLKICDEWNWKLAKISLLSDQMI